MANLTMRFVLAAVLFVAAAGHGRDDGASASVDNADVYAILQPDLSDPINALEHQVNQQLAQDEAKVERSMPKRLTNADTALDKATDAATIVVSRQEARIHKELMTHVSPQAVELGDPTPPIESKAQAAEEAKMRAEVMKSIDPSMVAGDLPKSKTPSKSSFSGMKKMIDAAMDDTHNIRDMGESFDSKDELGDGIERYVHAKRDEREKTKAAVSKQLGAAAAQLAKLQSSLHVHELIEIKEGEEPPADTASSPVEDAANNPCAAEDAAAAAGPPPPAPGGVVNPPKKSACNSPKVVEKDRNQYLLPPKISAHVAPNGTKALNDVLASHTGSTNPFAKVPGNSTSNETVVAKQALDDEIKTIHNTNLTAADKKKTHVEPVTVFKPVKPFVQSPPVSKPAASPADVTSNVEKPVSGALAKITQTNDTSASELISAA